MSSLDLSGHGRQDTAYQVFKDVNRLEKDTVLINPIALKNWRNFVKT